MKNQRIWRTLGAGIVAGTILLTACADRREERLEGALRTLSALPDLELVSTDVAAGVLTVRSRSSGAVTTIDLGAKSSVRAIDRSGQLAGTAPAVEPAADEPAGTEVAAAATDLARPGEYATPFVDAADLSGTDTEPAAAEPATGNPAAAAVVVRDRQGRVQVIEGSGFRIERAPGSARTAGTNQAPVAARTAATGGIPAAGARQRLSVPVVCGAGETRSLQGVVLDVPGAGIVAERGCTLTIANVQVRSGDWGLVVNPGASVRIDDSVIEGRTGALDLHPGASLSAWATTFRGALGRPVEPPTFVDRGDNRWQ
ncbi:MAG: hypothetical protein R3E75_00985 [Steroidobacteraceae bacterium]